MTSKDQLLLSHGRRQTIKKGSKVTFLADTLATQMLTRNSLNSRDEGQLKRTGLSWERASSGPALLGHLYLITEGGGKPPKRKNMAVSFKERLKTGGRSLSAASAGTGSHQADNKTPTAKTKQCFIPPPPIISPTAGGF